MCFFWLSTPLSTRTSVSDDQFSINLQSLFWWKFKQFMRFFTVDGGDVCFRQLSPPPPFIKADVICGQQFNMSLTLCKMYDKFNNPKSANCFAATMTLNCEWLWIFKCSLNNRRIRWSFRRMWVPRSCT